MRFALTITLAVVILSALLAELFQDDQVVADVTVITNGVQYECIPNEQKTKWVCKAP